MSNLSAVLFPHAGLSEPELGKILSFFDSLAVCLPWHMDPAGILAGDLPAGVVKILRPPETLDPGSSFPKALADYRTWIGSHSDRSGLAFLKTGAGLIGDEDPLWDIRRRIREGGLPASPPDAGEAFRWHMVVHLAHELEEQRDEADRILNALREKRSPLIGLTDDSDEIQSLFEDLPTFDWAPEAGRTDPSPTVEAWLGLFGSVLDSEDLLVTLDRRYLEAVSGLLSEPAGSPGLGPPVLRFPYPNLSGHPLERLADIRREHLSGEASLELGRLLREFAKDPSADMNELSQKAEELAAFCPEGLASSRVMLTAVRLPRVPAPTADAPCEATAPEGLRERTLIHLEDAPR